MSGGSWGYLYSRAYDDIDSLAVTAADMSLALGKNGAQRAAAMTAMLSDDLRRAADAVKLLEGAWQAQEWVDSGDWSVDQLLAEEEKLK